MFSEGLLLAAFFIITLIILLPSTLVTFLWSRFTWLPVAVVSEGLIFVGKGGGVKSGRNYTQKLHDIQGT